MSRLKYRYGNRNSTSFWCLFQEVLGKNIVERNVAMEIIIHKVIPLVEEFNDEGFVGEEPQSKPNGVDMRTSDSLQKET